jgi:hypothetical protein
MEIISDDEPPRKLRSVEAERADSRRRERKDEARRSAPQSYRPFASHASPPPAARAIIDRLRSRDEAERAPVRVK